jgi:putative ABC transport system substrate-binding protein
VTQPRILGALLVMLLAVLPEAQAQTQTPGRVARVGALGTAPSPAWEYFRQGLRDLGWVEGKNLIIEWRFTKGRSELHAEHAAEFARLKVDVIFAPFSLQVEAARKATRTIPIVFCCHIDPVGHGHVASLTRPAGNITGVANFTLDITTKRLEVLKKTLPHAIHVGVLNNPDYVEHAPAMAALQEAGARLGVRFSIADARHPDEFESAYAALSRARVDAVFVLFTPATYVSREQLAQLELKYRLPSAHMAIEHAQAGALMSYGVSSDHIMQRSATFVDRILRGAKPGELPIEQATKYDFAINLRTAKALGIVIPQTALLSATEMIE